VLGVGVENDEVVGLLAVGLLEDGPQRGTVAAVVLVAQYVCSC
jgi:hypothetical protein